MPCASLPSAWRRRVEPPRKNELQKFYGDVWMDSWTCLRLESLKSETWRGQVLRVSKRVSERAPSSHSSWVVFDNNALFVDRIEMRQFPATWDQQSRREPDSNKPTDINKLILLSKTIHSLRFRPIRVTSRRFASCQLQQRYRKSNAASTNRPRRLPAGGGGTRKLLWGNAHSWDLNKSDGGIPTFCKPSDRESQVRLSKVD